MKPSRNEHVDAEAVVDAALVEIDGMSSRDGAEHLNQRGIKTPNGAQWSQGLVFILRQRKQRRNEAKAS